MRGRESWQRLRGLNYWRRGRVCLGWNLFLLFFISTISRLLWWIILGEFVCGLEVNCKHVFSPNFMHGWLLIPSPDCQTSIVFRFLILNPISLLFQISWGEEWEGAGLNYWDRNKGEHVQTSKLDILIVKPNRFPFFLCWYFPGRWKLPGVNYWGGTRLDPAWESLKLEHCVVFHFLAPTSSQQPHALNHCLSTDNGLFHLGKASRGEILDFLETPLLTPKHIRYTLE